MTTSPSDTEAPAEDGNDPLQELAEAVVRSSVPVSSRGGSRVGPSPSATERWVEAATAARDQGLVFLSWLSAIDWSNDVEVGDRPPRRSRSASRCCAPSPASTTVTC